MQASQSDADIAASEPNQTAMIAVHNLKGGVTKTTSTLELAHEMAVQGLRVLLVDTDMQGNLTTRFVQMKALKNLGIGPTQDTDSFETATNDELFKAAGVNIDDPSFFNCFHHILAEVTGLRTVYDRSKLKKIKPLSNTDGTITLDLIAGHVRTASFDVKVFKGFTDPSRARVPGLVTNVIREFANLPSQDNPSRPRYDVVLFDCGPYLSSITVSVLLGVDYIVSPFKPERDCITAAYIMPRRIDAWHRARTREASDDDYDAIAVIDRVVAGSRSQGDSASLEVDSQLQGFPFYLGAFPNDVRSYGGRSPLQPEQRLIDAIYEKYQHALPPMHKNLVHRKNNVRIPKSWKEERESGRKIGCPQFDEFKSSNAFISSAGDLCKKATAARSGLPCMGSYVRSHGHLLTKRQYDYYAKKGIAAAKSDNAEKEYVRTRFLYEIHAILELLIDKMLGVHKAFLNRHRHPKNAEGLRRLPPTVVVTVTPLPSKRKSPE